VNPTGTAWLNPARIAQVITQPRAWTGVVINPVSSSIRCRHHPVSSSIKDVRVRARVVKEGQTIVPDSDRSRRHSDPTPHM